MGQGSALLVTALLGGAGVALIQALVPAMIKREFHHRDPRQAGQLAAVVQGVVFLINAISPWLTGWLRELTGTFVSAWVVLTVTAVACW